MTVGLLEQIRDQLKSCNAVSSEREFCEQWLGKSACYMRTLRFTGTAPSADALSVCASKLKWHERHLAQSTQSHHVHWARVFGKLHTQCIKAIEIQAERKWRSRNGILHQ